MRNVMKNYKDDRTGAVTVDWIVLTGLVVSLTLSVISALSAGLIEAGGALTDRAATTPKERAQK